MNQTKLAVVPPSPPRDHNGCDEMTNKGRTQDPFWNDSQKDNKDGAR